MPRGKIRERTAGKLVDTWHYEYEGIRSEDAVCQDEQESAIDSAKRVDYPVARRVQGRGREGDGMHPGLQGKRDRSGRVR